MNKDDAIKLLDDFYEEMKEAELLAYQSCNKRDEQMEYLFDKYADLIKESGYGKETDNM